MYRTLTACFILAAALPLRAEEKPTLEQQLLAETAENLAQAARKQGDARRGAILFHRPHIGCSKCHAVGAGLSLLGPDLTKLDKKTTTAAHLVESILAPSKVIRDEYRAVVVVTADGKTVAGLLAAERPAEIELRDPANPGKPIRIPKKEIDERTFSPISLMPANLANQLADRGQFLDLVRYVIDVSEQGPALARKLQPNPKNLAVAVENVDHAAQIRDLARADLKKGEQLYTQHCVSCHGKDGNKTLNPLARRFSLDPLKFGTDPYAMWKTITYGNGLMLPQAAIMTPTERYAVVHYLREQFLKGPNPSQYFKPEDQYLAKVNGVAAEDAKKLAPPPAGDRGANMDYGTAIAHSLAFPGGKESPTGKPDGITERALMVRLPADAVVCYDTDRGAVAGVWRGTLANTANTHHTGYKGGTCLSPGGKVVYANADDAGWSVGDPTRPTDEKNFRFRGHHLHGGQVLLRFEVDGRQVDELPDALGSDPLTLLRTLRVGPGKSKLFCQVARLRGGTAVVGEGSASLKGNAGEVRAAVSGQVEGLAFVTDEKGGLWLEIPAHAQARTFNLRTAYGGPLAQAAGDSNPDLDALTRGGPRRWPQVVRTSIVQGEPIEGYAADDLTLPYANPWNSWMRTTAIDFFADGRMAVATLSGDVFIGAEAKAGSGTAELTWGRFATGLYEPLGLRVVDDKVYVRGRDRITRLHDVNGDGEADHYENFFQEGIIGSGYHAFLFDLQTDRAGNFYYAKSGRKTPHAGGVVRVSPDGTKFEMVCHDFRHPNGMGAGGPKDWITVSDNPHGVDVFNGVAIVRPGAKYGLSSPRTTPMLAVLPPAVDSSSGGQCWADPDWGPLGSAMIHTSYSRCRALYVLTQDVGEHPNGFAVALPFALKSGAMRARVSPTDKQVYVVGQKGWDTTARFDGCLYRIRHAGGPTHLVTKAAATANGIELTFSCDLDPKSVAQENFAVIRDEEKGVKPVRYEGVRLIDKRTVEVRLPDIAREVVAERTKTDPKTNQTTVAVYWPIRVTTAIRAADGVEIKQIVYATINSLP